VFLSLNGSLWDVDTLELDKCLNHTDKFERGQEDIFEFRLPLLGDILSVKVIHDNSGLTNPVRRLHLRIITFVHHQHKPLSTGLASSRNRDC
jgi:hypothetical protein